MIIMNLFIRMRVNMFYDQVKEAGFAASSGCAAVLPESYYVRSAYVRLIEQPIISAEYR